MKKSNKDLEYQRIVDELFKVEQGQELLDFKINSLKSMMAKYVENERKQK